MIDMMLVLAGESAYVCHATLPVPTYGETGEGGRRLQAGWHKARIDSACRAMHRVEGYRGVVGVKTTVEELWRGKDAYPRVYWEAERGRRVCNVPKERMRAQEERREKFIVKNEKWEEEEG
jgi:hypothetical protein